MVWKLLLYVVVVIVVFSANGAVAEDTETGMVSQNVNEKEVGGASDRGRTSTK